METVINEYYANNGKKLHKMVDKILLPFGGLSDKDTDDFYSLANEVFVDVLNRYDKEQSFDGFLHSCLSNKIKTEMTRRNRQKRMADRMAVSIDTPIGDDESSTYSDVIASNIDVETEIFKDELDKKYVDFLNGLPNIQKQIVEMRMNDVPSEEIREILGLSNAQYNEHNNAIKRNKNISIFNKRNIEAKGVKEMKVVCESEVLDVMDIDTTDSYRCDKNPLGSVLEDLSMGFINRNYISQRLPFQWTDDKINKFYSRILNNQPIPEIVICEKVEDGEKVSYLIDGLQRLTYAEEFKENRIPVKAKGAEFVNIQYKKPVIDEEGKTKFVTDTFNIVGKYYKDLPKFLQKRFDNFNINVTRFFNCTSEMIDYHMRNYNNHVAMTKAQYGITNVSNATSYNIKSISEDHDFFKNCIKANDKSRRNGVLDEVVCKTMMTMYFVDDWKKEAIEVFKYLDTNATDKQYEHLKDNLKRLSNVFDESVKDLFNTTNLHIWLAVFDKFTELDIEDSRFIEFMKTFKEKLNNDINDEFIANVFKSRHTRDKSIITKKVSGIVEMMYEFLNVTNNETTIDAMEFVKENVGEDASEMTIEEYKEFFEDELEIEVDNSSKLLEENNLPSMLAIAAYVMGANITIGNAKKWFVDFFNRHNTYIKNQKENYQYMLNDLNSYVGKVAVA